MMHSHAQLRKVPKGIALDRFITHLHVAVDQLLEVSCRCELVHYAEIFVVAVYSRGGGGGVEELISLGTGEGMVHTAIGVAVFI